MTISAIDPTTSTTAGANPSSGPLKGTKDEFLRLFMAQLEHQDPLNPQDGSSMVAQLAQFSTVEQQQQTNQQLSDLAAAQASLSSASMSSLVGRDCKAAAGEFQIDGHGAMPPMSVTASGPTKGAALVISDGNGKEIRRIPIADGATSAELAWDGKTASGAIAPPGNYKVSIDAGTTSSSISAQWHGRIDAVELTSDGPRLRMGEVLFAPGDVRTIGTNESQPALGARS
jgi:flagellar basal-body rod modification protein FlgD